MRARRWIGFSRGGRGPSLAPLLSARGTGMLAQDDTAKERRYPCQSMVGNR